MKARLPKNTGVQAAPNNMQAMIKQAQKMQDEMKIKQDELELEEYVTTSGGGAVTCTMSGKKEIKSLVIKPEVVNADDLDMLQDLVIVAVNECIKIVEETTSEAMEKITGGISIPGLF
ncbi:MAG: YbaB/EbfC family nucleoid-associated protein [Oscillospiraceae bacterium]